MMPRKQNCYEKIITYAWAGRRRIQTVGPAAGGIPGCPVAVRHPVAGCAGVTRSSIHVHLWKVRIGVAMPSLTSAFPLAAAGRLGAGRLAERHSARQGAGSRFGEPAA